MDRERLERQFDFIKEIDKEKFIQRQTRLSDNARRENDAEHAWHMAIMTVLLSEYANEKIDVLRTVIMLLIHDIVEIDAGDTYAYDEERQKTQHERESQAADRIYALLPEDQQKKMRDIWEEFEEAKTPEAKFAHTMDNLQPAMLNTVNGGVAWKERGIAMSQIMKRNVHTAEGSQDLWDYAYENFFKKNIDAGNIVDDSEKRLRS